MTRYLCYRCGCIIFTTGDNQQDSYADLCSNCKQNDVKSFHNSIEIKSKTGRLWENYAFSDKIIKRKDLNRWWYKIIYEN